MKIDLGHVPMLDNTPDDDGTTSYTVAWAPHDAERETEEILRDHPDLLERIARFKRGASKLIPWKEAKRKLGLEDA